MMDRATIEKKIKEFVGLISANRIKLLSLQSKTNKNLSGVLTGSNIERSVEFKLKSIGTGEQNDNELIIFGEYEIDIEDKMEDMSLVSLNAAYKLILTIKENDEYGEELTEEQQTIAEIFFDQSGRLILFPYVRHIYDLITREADFFMPPIPPIVFKK